MCLILFAWQTHPRYPLIVAANRDEFHQRPAAAADFWHEQPDLLAGRDLEAGGTWLGLTRSGRFAAITNYRESPVPGSSLERSRGDLVRNYLEQTSEPMAYARGLTGQASEYRGFNLLMGAGDSLVYASNRDGAPVEVERGVHGLSNHLLDTDWPKVRSGRERLDELIREDSVSTSSLLALLTDRAMTPGDFPENLEEDLVQRELANHYFIVSPVYGTRCSTVVLVDRDGSAEFVERQFDTAGTETGTRRFEFSICEE